MCKWIYHITHPESADDNTVDVDGDVTMSAPAPKAPKAPKARKVLIHCSDGYTESSLLAIAYFMFAEGVPAHEAWVRLHSERKRNFFAYPSDVTFLTSVQNKLLCESPAACARQMCDQPEPGWLAKMDGSLPSRILPYMYLGNLAHANNPTLLRSLGIRRLLSIGEPVSWSREDAEKWGSDNLMMIDDVQDNGIDPLTPDLDRCLDFIGECYFFLAGDNSAVHAQSAADDRLQGKEKKMGRPRWCIVESAFPGRQLSALLK
jgi:dual specificity MAP kinase phosphatase